MFERSRVVTYKTSELEQFLVISNQARLPVSITRQDP